MKIMMLVGLLPGLFLVGCAESPRGLPDTTTSISPADPSAASRGRDGGSVVGAYTHRAVREPATWRGTGVEMAPVSGGETSR